MATAAELIDHPLLLDAPRAAAGEVLDRIALHERGFDAGEIVALQGDALNRLTVITTGKLAATMDSPTGRSLMVETLSAPEILAPGALLATDPRLPVTLTAVTDGGLGSISLEALRELGDRFPAVYRNLLRMTAEKFSFVTTKMRLLHFATLRQKMAGFLLELSSRVAGHAAPAREGSPVRSSWTVTLPYGRERLAELFGVARPSLSRVLGELVDESLVRVSRARVEIVDRAALERVLREER